MTDMTDAPDGETKSYEDLTVEQLKEVLKSRDLPTSGNKAELIERLIENDAAIDPAEGEQAPAEGGDEDTKLAGASAVAFDGGVKVTYANPEDAPEPEDDVPADFASYVGTEADPSLSDRRAEELARWRAENPDATVIPPALLPPEFADGTIATHGLPEEQGA